MENAVRGPELTKALKDVTLTILNELISHNIKGADLIKKGLEEVFDIKQELEDHYESLKTLLMLLKPLFEIARDWLVECYGYLVELFDWAKEKWHEIFDSTGLSN